MMQQAAHDATLYCAEAKRMVIMPRDIELALKRLVLPGSAYWTRDDLSEEAQQAVFSLSNERAGPKDRKYDPSRSHYKKVSLLRDRLIPAIGTILQL